MGQQPVRGTDVVLGTNAETGEPVLLPYMRRPEHLMIVGGTGTGKTTLLERLIRQDILDGTACVVFDVHGDMTDNLLRFVSTQPAWAARTLLVELDPTGADPPFGANLYEVPKPGMAGRAIDGVEAYLRRFWGEVVSGAVIESGLENTTRTIVANPGYTMAEVPLLYTNPAFRNKLLRAIPDTPGPGQYLHQYWRAYDDLARPFDREMWYRSIVNKLERFLTNEDTYPVLSQERSTIAWEEILNGGYCLLIRLPLSAGERSTEQLNALLVNLLTRQLAARAGATDAKNRPRVHLYLDEYRRLASEQTTTLLYEARKANVGVTVAMQSLADLESEISREATLQTATRLAFRTTAAVAKVVAIGFAQPPRVVPVKKGICQNPVDYLASHTHPNPAVRALAQTSLAPLLTELERESGTRISVSQSSEILPMINPRVNRYLRSLWPPAPRGPSVSNMSAEATRLSTARTELNKLLVDVMEGRETPGSRQVLGRILDVFFERFGGKSGGVCCYIATMTARELCTPGTPDAQALTNHIGHGTDFALLCLGDETALLRLLMVKQSGLTGAAVQAANEAAAAAFRKRQRQESKEADKETPPFFSDPPSFYGHGIYGRDRPKAIEEVSVIADFRDRADPRYTKYLSYFEHAQFWPGLFSQTAVTEFLAKVRKIIESWDFLNPAARDRHLAFVDEFGESALVMAWLWLFAQDADYHARNWEKKYWYDPMRWFPWPLVTGLPLATTILLLSGYQGNAWQPVPAVDALKHPEDERRPGVLRIYHELVTKIKQVKTSWPGGDKEADLTARLLLYKAQLGLRDQTHADRLLPDGSICPPGPWPLVDHPGFQRPGTPRPVQSRLAPHQLRRLIADTVPELRELLMALDIEKQLYRQSEGDGSALYEQARIRMTTLNQAQRAALRAYCRQTLLGDEADKSEEALCTTYPHEYRFLSDIHRLCELLAKEPIEVSAGPQEERQQTTADVINEVERQLTQLGTGEAYHALLQEDGTTNADKIKLLPPPDLPPDNPALIEKIRHRSKQRFSRPRAEIDAATLRRQNTTAATPPSPQPPPPPGAGTGRPAAQHPRQTRQHPRQPQQQPRQTPPPDSGPPPIGRR